MLKSIIFDFDGVILESAEIKTEAFVELFSDYPQKVKDIVDHHLENAGISRYVKFRYIYKNILGKKLSKEKEVALGKQFSQIALHKILNVSFVVGAKEFLTANFNRYLFFIASGTPEDELKNIVSARRLKGYFKEVHGSPKKKKDIINSIIEKYGFSKTEVVYIGDAPSDRKAAEEARIFFIERLKDFYPESDSSPWKIRNLSNLSDILKQVEKLDILRSL